MPTLHLDITLETDLVLSSSAATVGGHVSLQRIRGSALLGACAAQGYEGPLAFDLFHSGRVRYSDALPAVDDSVALPVPLALHSEKGTPSPTSYFNLSVEQASTGDKLEQQRSRFVEPCGRVRQVATTYTMRTAVDEHGQARGGFLFGLETVSAGQTFRATIDADSADLLAEVERRLVGRAHRLGRSRSAEFGLARIERGSFKPWPVVSGTSDIIRILCVSDLALRDARTCAPRLVPASEDFGLPDGTSLDLTRCFVRTARYSPYNAHRRRHDLERQVIVAGSVLVFKGAVFNLDELRVRLANGVGEHLVDGLGRVLVQPRLLEDPKWTPLSAISVPPEDPKLCALPDDELGHWMSVRAAEVQVRTSAWSLSRSWAEEMKGFRSVPVAQWGELRRLAAAARFSGRGRAAVLEELRRRLGLEATAGSGISKRKTLGRSATATRWSGERRQGRTAAEHLIALLERADESIAIVALEQLGVRMVRLLRQEDHDGSR